MKINFLECDGCFAFDLVAENMEEAARLVRFGMNRTQDLRHAETNVSREGEFTASVVIGKAKSANSNVPQR